MEKPRILLIRADAGELGDRIRIDSIKMFLQNSGYAVRDLGLPWERARRYITKAGVEKVLKNLFPLRTYRPYHLWRSPLWALKFTLAQNFVKRISRDLVFDVILAETSLIGWCALELARTSSKPFIVDIHGLAGAEAIGYNDSSWLAKEIMERETIQYCTHVLVVSEEMKKHIAYHFEIPAEKITVIHNGTNPPESLAKFNHPLKVIYAGRFVYYERVDDYLEIAKKANPDSFKFYIAGSGPLRSHLLARLKKEAIPITFLDYVPRRDMLAIFSQMQVGIAPSTKDIARLVAFPIKVLDYMSCGLPVITPRIGDWGRMIEREDCGIALAEDSVESYVAALETISRRDVWLKKSHNAAKAAEKRYNWNNVLLPLRDVVGRFVM